LVPGPGSPVPAAVRTVLHLAEGRQPYRCDVCARTSYGATLPYVSMESATGSRHRTIQRCRHGGRQLDSRPAQTSDARKVDHRGDRAVAIYPPTLWITTRWRRRHHLENRWATACLARVEASGPPAPAATVTRACRSVVNAAWRDFTAPSAARWKERQQWPSLHQQAQRGGPAPTGNGRKLPQPPLCRSGTLIAFRWTSSTSGAGSHFPPATRRPTGSQLIRSNRGDSMGRAGGLSRTWDLFEEGAPA
jgi:hypothetical protein